MSFTTAPAGVAELAFLDTNVLLYSITEEDADLGKRDIALDLLDRDDCALSTQTLLEFYNQATHPKRKDTALLPDHAWGLIASWRRFPVQEQSVDLLEAAHELRKRTGYSIWDSLIVAAAQALGCTTLYTEDLQHGRVIDGLRIVNPFARKAPQS